MRLYIKNNKDTQSRPMTMHSIVMAKRQQHSVGDLYYRHTETTRSQHTGKNGWDLYYLRPEHGVVALADLRDLPRNFFPCPHASNFIKLGEYGGEGRGFFLFEEDTLANGRKIYTPVEVKQVKPCSINQKEVMELWNNLLEFHQPGGENSTPEKLSDDEASEIAILESLAAFQARDDYELDSELIDILKNLSGCHPEDHPSPKVREWIKYLGELIPPEERA